MADHSVSLAPVSFNPLNRAIVAMLSLVGKFVSPSASASQLEQDLLAKFADSPIDPAGILAWLESLGAAYQDLDMLVQQFAADPSGLHKALQSQNDAGGVVLLQVAHAAQLVDAASGAALHAGQDVAHWLLRSGYSDDQGYGMYFDLFAAGQSQPVHIPWQSIINAGITSAIALSAPKAPVDRAVVQHAVQIVESSIGDIESHISTALAGLGAVKAAHADILSLLG